ncbi:double-strand break repair helicase AddA [Falsiroseomonas selenitidurans]|uniref:DNA 3'-5' helicase n=1 Tax=Falsiroseomonas selenitidurans TaxID=2716335 RepID=A0ABX1E965_9PROT|nr:double-strand break repair helicase AddA [Falsiroseomonas selenitidurans]NKC32307.1 double-strand break repair helicase AddA [Falsiroseomonas selenitidurans]
MSGRSLTARQEAEAAQAEASAPASSAWVGASAGSGKTKVLTDRVLRLLLAPGTRPGAILCLTFTKAAAAEMATRLARDLGRWAVEPESQLAARLGALLGRAPDRRDLDAARGLFARVLDLPGGMRISTIHAFCQSLLRAFPLEAGLAPHFGVAEEADAADLLAAAREAVLAAPAQAPALEALASLVPPDAFARLVAALDRDRERLAEALRGAGSLERLCACIGQHLGLPEAAQEAALVEAAAQDADPQAVMAARLLEASRNKNDRDRGLALLDWLQAPPAQRAARWADWVALLLTKDGTPRARLATKEVGPRQAECAEILRREAERVAAMEGSRRASRLLAATRALLSLGAPVLEGYRARKRARGLLDYDDLILAARQVLRDPGSAWVLFKLDGGLDHVLLDEAQDSNPAQWGIAAALTEEFFAGHGRERRAEAPPRTIFAVGDVKQSIYGFQGADAAGFIRWKAHFAERLAALGERLRDLQLQVSFRSTAPVLALVDAVFAEGPAREGVVAAGEGLRHRPDRAGQAGCVELWPMLEAAEPEPPPEWEVPDTPAAATGADALLAEALAARIATWLREGERLPSRDRPMRAGDILVLVRKRSGGLLPRLVRALKQHGVPVGGADRIRLAEQIAVQDLLALADALLLPEDDLQLAAALKSPLVGLDEAQLFALAQGRTGSLWSRLAALRGQDSAAGHAADFLAGLMARADLVTPHALFAEILGEHRGRQRLLARLGPDAADPVEELLNAALAYGARHPPSLQGFVHWLRRGGAEVKRDQEAAGDAVRIMTVHGAKGLQAPVVILPDTVAPGRDTGDVRWVMEPDAPPLPLWAPNKDHHAPAFATLLATEKAARAEEEHRLLYVALTRAEDRLLVCGWQKRRPKTRDWPEACWYDLIAQGFARLEAAEAPLGDFGAPVECRFAGATLRQLVSPQEAPPRPDGRDAPPPEAAGLPGWAHRPAPAEAVLDALAPSAVPGENEPPAAAPHGAADPTGQRFRRGRLVHALLQHLPDRPPAERTKAGAAFLARRGHALPPEAQAEILAEVLALLDAPTFAAAFGPDSLAEAPIAGRLGNRLVSGQVDRLLVAPDRVLVLDYKTNRPPPADAAQVPALYLRQMAAYRAVLRQAFPGRRVDCALVWTFGARLMPLVEGLLDSHAPSA